MLKLLMSPCIFDFSKCASEKERRIQIDRIRHIGDFIEECLEESEIFLLEHQLDMLENVIPKCYSENPALFNHIVSTFKIFQKHYSSFKNTGDSKNFDIDKDFVVQNTLYSNSFQQCFNSCVRNDFDGFIIIGEQNERFEGKSLDSNSKLICLYNPYTCEYSIIKNAIKDKLPFRKKYFEMERVCEHTNYYFDTHTGSRFDRVEFFFLFGKITAVRNGYVYDKRLSTLNSRKSGTRRDVYVRYSPSGKPKYYLSVDTERGALELFTHNKPKPIHKGEYNFSCNKNKEAKPLTHPLYI